MRGMANVELFAKSEGAWFAVLVTCYRPDKHKQTNTVIALPMPADSDWRV